MVMRTEKLTISIPRNLLEVTDEIAKERKTTRSKIVSDCLRELAEKRFEEHMIAGYKATAKSNLEFAEDSIHLVNEVLNQE